MFELSFTASSFAKWSHSAYTVFQFFTVRMYFSVCNIKRNQYVIGLPNEPPLYRALLLVLTPVYTCWVKRCASFMSSFAKTCAALVLLYYLADTDCSPSPKKNKTKQKMADGSPRRRCISPPPCDHVIVWLLGEWGGSFRKFMPNATFPVKTNQIVNGIKILLGFGGIAFFGIVPFHMRLTRLVRRQ